MSGRLHKLAANGWCVLLIAGCAGDVSDALSGSGGEASHSVAPRCTTPADAEVLANQLIQLINLERSERGLDPVVPDSDELLSDVAADYACSMIEGGFFAHEDLETKSTPAKRIISSGYRASAVGENLAAGQRSAGEVVEQWMNSESHRENLLSPEWREVGVAVRAGGAFETYWVLELAAPRQMYWDFEYPALPLSAEAATGR